MEPSLSIVIVEFNRLDEVSQSVEAIRRHLSGSYEIIVSSNSCYDSAARERIVRKYTQATWVFNERNGGFAYAMNEGLRRAKGDYLVIMNSDCILNSDLDGMVAFMKSHPDIGAIAPQMRDVEGNIQDTARPYVSLPRFLFRQLRRVLGHKNSILNPGMDYSRVQTVDWFIGAFIMVSRAAYEKTGGLDDGYFMYAEDLDWCSRIRQQGLELVYYPKTTITYKGTRRARTDFRYAKIFVKSHLRYWRKFGFVWGYPGREARFFEE